MTRWLAALALSGVTFLFAVSFNSCSTLPRAVEVPLEIPGAKFAGNRACFDCHTNYVRTFSSSPHSRIRMQAAGALGNQTGCESCHGPGSLHVAAGGGRGKFIINPGKNPEACFQCHLATHVEFRLPQHHPVLEGHMNCVNCHDPHGFDIYKTAGGLAMARQNESCAACHREQARLRVFEHRALREGCTVCHQPHGSINAKLLVERDANLCLKCHAQQPGVTPGSIYIGLTDHTTFLRMGTCYSAGCHTAVHGSDVDHRLRY